MFDISRAMKFGAVALMAALVFAMAAPSYADNGTVRIRAASAGFIVGVGGGTGTLTFHGRSYPLSVGGLSLGMIGAASTDLVGRAHNLRRPEDIVGTYTAAGAGLAIAGGASVARLRNANGVVLELRGRQVGFQASIDLSGITISMR